MADLAATSVFFDFDGTITTTDVGVYLLEQLASDEWKALDVEYAAGRLGSRHIVERQWRCIPDSVTEEQRRATAREIPIDPGFGPLVDGLLAAGAEVAVVSDGFGYYVDEVIAPWALPVFTNGIDFATQSLLTPHADPACVTCGLCGTCKPRIVRRATERGRPTIFIGDGTSDRHAARVADVVFAKGALADWCAAEGIPHQRFDVLNDVAAALLS